MLKFMYKLKNNNKGSESITRVISYMMFFLILAFTLDLVVLGMNMVMASHQTMYLSKKLSVQGGFIGSPAQGNKKSESWLYNEEIFSRINNAFQYVGIGSNDWELISHDNGYDRQLYNYGFTTPASLNYVSPFRTLKNASDPLTHSTGYGTVTGITIKFRFRWRFSGRMILGSFSPIMTMHSNYRSEYFR